LETKLNIPKLLDVLVIT